MDYAPRLVCPAHPGSCNLQPNRTPWETRKERGSTSVPSLFHLHPKSEYPHNSDLIALTNLFPLLHHHQGRQSALPLLKLCHYCALQTILAVPRSLSRAHRVDVSAPASANGCCNQ